MRVASACFILFPSGSYMGGRPTGLRWQCPLLSHFCAGVDKQTLSVFEVYH